MEKIKSILNPGKGSVEHTLYGSGQGDNPVVERLSKGDGQHTGLQSSATSPPRPMDTMQDESSTATGQGSNVGSARQTQAGSGTGYTGSERHGASQADANLLASREADRDVLAGGGQSNFIEDDRDLRPEHPTPVSIPSNASIKSNVVGRVPTGSNLVQKQGDLPKVPATDGKFMNDEALILENSATTISSNNTSILAAPTTGISGIDNTQPQDSHHGGDAAALSAAGAVGAAGTVATAGSHSATSASTSSEPPTLTEVPATSTSHPGPSSMSSRLQDDMRTKHMPGAYPETPVNESDKMLGSDVTGVASGAAVIAAQKAYGNQSTAHTATSKPAEHKVEPSPYNAGVDPRVDTENRHGDAYKAAGIAAGAGTAGAGAGAGAYGISQHQNREDVSSQPTNLPAKSSLAATESASQAGIPQGTFAEKIQDAQAHDNVSHHVPAAAAATTAPGDTATHQQGTHVEHMEDTDSKENSHKKDYALAGGGVAAAAGAGAYGISKYQDRSEPSTTQTEAFPSFAQQPEQPSTNDWVRAPASTFASTDTQVHNGREFPLATTHDRSHETQSGNIKHPTGTQVIDTQTTSPMQPRSDITSQKTPLLKDAAETGAAGVGGAAAYEALKHDQEGTVRHRSSDFDDPLASSAHPKALEGYDDQRALPVHDSHTTGHMPVLDKSEDKQRNRDAALAGAGILGGGAAAGALAARHDEDDKLEKERAKVAERKHAEHEKQAEKARKSEEKTRRSEEKARRSEEKHRRKSDEKEHKHGLLHKILHRHKSKEDLEKEKENETQASIEKPTTAIDRSSPEQPEQQLAGASDMQSDSRFADQNEYSTGGASPVVSNSGTPEKHGRNRLHKDPPAGYTPKHT